MGITQLFEAVQKSSEEKHFFTTMHDQKSMRLNLQRMA